MKKEIMRAKFLKFFVEHEKEIAFLVLSRL